MTTPQNEQFPQIQKFFQLHGTSYDISHSNGAELQHRLNHWLNPKLVETGGLSWNDAHLEAAKAFIDGQIFLSDVQAQMLEKRFAVLNDAYASQEGGIVMAGFSPVTGEYFVNEALLPKPNGEPHPAILALLSGKI